MVKINLSMIIDYLVALGSVCSICILIYDRNINDIIPWIIILLCSIRLIIYDHYFSNEG